VVRGFKNATSSVFSNLLNSKFYPWILHALLHGYSRVDVLHVHANSVLNLDLNLVLNLVHVLEYSCTTTVYPVPGSSTKFNTNRPTFR
jgi:hypothetical protein